MVVVRGTGSPRLHLHICLLLLGLPEAGGSAQGADPPVTSVSKENSTSFLFCFVSGHYSLFGVCVFSVQFPDARCLAQNVVGD